MVCGSPVLCIQQGERVMRLVLCDGTVRFCWCLDLCSVGWQVCCFSGEKSGLSAPCYVFSVFLQTH